MKRRLLKPSAGGRDHGSRRLYSAHITSNTDTDSVVLAERGEPILVDQTGVVPNDLEQLQQRHNCLENELESLAEEIERLEHE